MKSFMLPNAAAAPLCGILYVTAFAGVLVIVPSVANVKLPLSSPVSPAPITGFA